MKSHHHCMNHCTPFGLQWRTPTNVRITVLLLDYNEEPPPLYELLYSLWIIMKSQHHCMNYCTPFGSYFYIVHFRMLMLFLVSVTYSTVVSFLSPNNDPSPYTLLWILKTSNSFNRCLPYTKTWFIWFLWVPPGWFPHCFTNVFVQKESPAYLHTMRGGKSD
jgi:hypothetical protein